VLDLYAWGKSDPGDFGWFEPPPAAAIESAKRLLEMLGAIDSRGITAMGRRLAKLPVHPRLGRMLCAAADEGCAEEGAALAALLSERDVRHSHSDGPITKSDSDLLVQMDDPFAMRQIAPAKGELWRIARRLSSAAAKKPSHEALLKLPLWAYPDRVCRRREGDSAAGVMCDGGGVRLAAESVVRDSEFFVALDARHDPRSASREAIVRTASAIRSEWLFEMFPQSIHRRRMTVFDPKRQRVVGHGMVEYRDLVLWEDFDAPVDAEEAGAALAAALRPRATEIFGGNESAAALLARLAFLRRWMPEHSWPVMDENELGDLLAELCAGKRSVEEVIRSPLAEAVAARLAWPLPRVLSEQAPETMEVPSGSRIRLVYPANQPPILAVRLQEIFGWRQTPRVAGGRVAILLHLLGPNFQPVQITDDLQSFWATTYFQVRKDLRVRYPRHSWPEDPLTAKPQAKGGKRKAD
jgi:ATP-dependent helicase HrpB